MEVAGFGHFHNMSVVSRYERPVAILRIGPFNALDVYAPRMLVQFGEPQHLEWDGDLGTPALVVNMGFGLPNSVPARIDSTPAIVFDAKYLRSIGPRLPRGCPFLAGSFYQIRDRSLLDRSLAGVRHGVGVRY